MQCSEAAHSLAAVLASWMSGLYVMYEQALMNSSEGFQGLALAYSPALGPDV